MQALRMPETTATIKNEAGIHCRPSAHIVKHVADFDGDMKVTNPDGESSDLRTMLSLMMLALTHGSVVRLETSGPGADEQLSKLVELFEFEYDFPPKD